MQSERQRIVVGTAGHIDHGKTSLVAALTGTDCDRLVEERERGITIDLGFAHLDVEEGHGAPMQIGFIDVPGHERFVHNALAGLGGIRLMMMVVAADEGIKPQTKEHLAICSLLEIPAGLVVLTKSDLVDEETLELAQLELQEALAGGPFDGVPMLPVSSKSGAGIAELKSKLIELAGSIADQQPPSKGPVRLPVDRAFHLKGLGVVVTGTQQGGAVTVGDSLALMPLAPQTKSAKIRSLQVHGEDRDCAKAGERVSAQLAGVDLSDVSRGTVLATEDSLPQSRVLLVRYLHLDSAPGELKASAEVRFHQFTSDTLARIRPLAPNVLQPGETGLCAMYLRKPVSVARGDRFILRRPSPATTLGGGEVLDPAWRKPRGRDLTQHIEALSQGNLSAVREWITVAREAGSNAQDLSQRLGVYRSAIDPILDQLLQDSLILEAEPDSSLGRRLVAPAKVKEVGERAGAHLREYFKRNRLAHGVPKAELLAAILPPQARGLSQQYLDWLSATRLIVVQGDSVNLPGRATGITDQESDLAKSMVKLFESEGLTPRSPPELQRSLGAPPKVFEGLLRYLTQQKTLVRLPSGLFLSQAALDGLKTEVLAQPWQEISVGDFKDHFGLSRKWAIPLLEYLDSQQVTRRQGNVRLVLR